MNNARILLVSGPAAGGMRRHLEALAERLPGWGSQVALAAPKAIGLTLPGGRFDLDLGDRPRPGPDLGALLALRGIVREWRPALVHAHGVKAALLALLALPQGIPVVVTFHNMWHGGPLTYPLRLLAPRAAAAIAVSSAVGNRLAAWGIRPRRLAVIPNGLDVCAFPPGPGRAPGQPFTVLFAGRLTEEKGIRVLLQTARLLPAALDLRLLVAGDGPLREEVEREGSAAGSRLQYLGHQDDMLPVYRQADLVVMPSLSEGLPMTALEAMASGVPVVASRVGGLPEVVVEGETGLLVEPNDPAALGRALEALAADPERAASMGAAGRRRVEAEFTLDRMMERLVQVYQDVLSGGRPYR
jgi:L-malate glycosyltransferase